MTLTIISFACHEDELLLPMGQGSSEITYNNSAIQGTRLGKKLKNPYSVTNMEIAWDSLSIGEGYNTKDVDIKPTHYYVKFSPSDERQLGLLKGDSTLILYDYPLDYDIEVVGDYYHDPNVPVEVPTPQYAAVNVKYKFKHTEIEYEILEELYIPDEKKHKKDKTGRITSESEAPLIDELVKESFRLTGNLPDDIEDQVAGDSNGKVLASNDWTPSGRIRVWDGVYSHSSIVSYTQVLVGYDDSGCEPCDICDEARVIGDGEDCRIPIYEYIPNYEDITGGYVPVQYAKVRARNWFTTHIGVTDANGNFECDGDFGDIFEANYSIKWEKYHFSIRSGTYGQATLNGPKKKGSWNRDIGASGATIVDDTQVYYALIFQAARDYFYGPRFGLASPPRNETFGPQIKLAAVTEQTESSSHAAVYVRYGTGFWGAVIETLPDIYIREWERHADRVYGTTIHELAHWAHWDLDHSAFESLVIDAYLLFWDSKEAVIESWPSGVEWVFTMDRYENLFNMDIFDYSYVGNDQWKRISPFQDDNDDLIYTAVVIDLIDDCNQRAENCDNLFNRTGDRQPIDNVNGYTILQIENSLRGATGWHEWKNNIINQHSNSTQAFVDELFDNWYD